MDTTKSQAAHDAAVDGGVVEKDLLRFLEAQTKRFWDPTVDLFATGGISSLFAMQLVVHLEKTYGISIRGADLRLDNFRTVHRMAALVRRLRPAALGATGE